MGKFVWTNSPEMLLKFPPALVLVHGWLLPGSIEAAEDGLTYYGVSWPFFYIIFLQSFRVNRFAGLQRRQLNNLDRTEAPKP